MIELRHDIYRAQRGGYSRALRLSCGACGTFLAWYQKDGPGPLKRLYADRLLCRRQRAVADGIRMVCSRCSHELGYMSIYVKERRPAIFLGHGSVRHRIVPLASVRHNQEPNWRPGAATSATRMPSDRVSAA